MKALAYGAVFLLLTLLFLSVPVFWVGYFNLEERLTTVSAALVERFLIPLGVDVERDGNVFTLSSGLKVYVFPSCIDLLYLAVIALIVMLLFYAILLKTPGLEAIPLFALIYLSTLLMNIFRMTVQLYVAETHPSLLTTMGWGGLEFLLVLNSIVILAIFWGLVALILKASL